MGAEIQTDTAMSDPIKYHIKNFINHHKYRMIQVVSGNRVKQFMNAFSRNSRKKLWAIWKEWKIKRKSWKKSLIYSLPKEPSFTKGKRGMKEGRQEGRKEGRKKGRKEGRKEGRKKERKNGVAQRRENRRLKRRQKAAGKKKR